MACFGPLPHYLEKVSHQLRYKILSLPPGQLDIQPIIATTQLQERSSTNWAISPRAKWSMHEGVRCFLRTATTSSTTPLIVKYRLLVESCESRESRILKIRGSKSFIKRSWWKKMWVKDPTESNLIHESKTNIGENPMPRKPKGSSARFVHGGWVRA